MKKLFLSLILFSALTAFATDDATLRLKEQIAIMKDLAFLRQMTDSTVPKAQDVSTNPVNFVENFIVAHPWYAIVSVAVVTYVAVKAYNYTSKSNKDDES